MNVALPVDLLLEHIAHGELGLPSPAVFEPLIARVLVPALLGFAVAQLSPRLARALGRAARACAMVALAAALDGGLYLGGRLLLDIPVFVFVAVPLAVLGSAFPRERPRAPH